MLNQQKMVLSERLLINLAYLLLFHNKKFLRILAHSHSNVHEGEHIM